MANTVFIILFEDHSIQTSMVRPDPGHYQEGARFFEANGDMPLYDVCQMASDGWRTDRFPGFIRDEIKEL